MRRHVNKTVWVDLDAAIYNTVEGWNEKLCEIAQEPLLQDIFWRIVGFTDSSLHLEVTGYVDEDPEERDEEGPRDVYTPPIPSPEKP
jgi:hypothetical protein